MKEWALLAASPCVRRKLSDCAVVDPAGQASYVHRYVLSIPTDVDVARRGVAAGSVPGRDQQFVRPPEGGANRFVVPGSLQRLWDCRVVRSGPGGRAGKPP